MSYARGRFTGFVLIFAIAALVVHEWLIGSALLLLSLLVYLFFKGTIKGFIMLLLIVFAIIGFFSRLITKKLKDSQEV